MSFRAWQRCDSPRIQVPLQNGWTNPVRMNPDGRTEGWLQGRGGWSAAVLMSPRSAQTVLGPQLLTSLGACFPS
ncbi:unnamed protein product [Lota lota]